MIEEAPIKPITKEVYSILMSQEYAGSISKMVEEYAYWDSVKYHVPKGIKPEDFWNAIKKIRQMGANFFRFSICSFMYKETNTMQALLHNFDMNFGGKYGHLERTFDEEIVDKKNPLYSLLNINGKIILI